MSNKSNQHDVSAPVESSASEAFMDSVRAGAASAQPRGATDGEVVLEARGVNVYYGDNHALHDTSLEFHKGEITALIGPSGCGKSTFLRSLNLMNREIRGCRVEGEILYDGRNINTREENLYELRRSIGMVFQQPNPFRKSIYENIVFAPKRHGLKGKENLDALVEESLRGAALWDEALVVLYLEIETTVYSAETCHTSLYFFVSQSAHLRQSHGGYPVLNVDADGDTQLYIGDISQG